MIGVGGQQVLVAGLEGQKFTATVVVIVVVVISILIDIVMQLL